MSVAVILAGMLAVAAPQDAPRFTLRPEPGDALKAELFRLAPGDPAVQARALLDGEEARAEDFETRVTGPLVMLYRRAVGPVGGMVLYAAPNKGIAVDAACLLTRNPGGTHDNSHRATDWCLSFVLKTAPTLNIPPAPL
ncbi:hypothetical protein [Brevundimonas faecalis]|uniref:Uncharacterized protein n=1 Tax=Brevundimonas faecalis TaxID=947378 RepID=A0ABV2RCS0_9CAUL